MSDRPASSAAASRKMGILVGPRFLNGVSQLSAVPVRMSAPKTGAKTAKASTGPRVLSSWMNDLILLNISVNIFLAE